MLKMDTFSSPLKTLIIRYLHHHQALGKLFKNEYHTLWNLDRFLTETGANDLTPESFLAWSTRLHRVASGVRRNQMRIVRNFCLYRQRSEPCCYVPSMELLPLQHHPVQPYIFTKEEIARLLQKTQELYFVSHSPLRCEAMRLAVVLLYSTGIRISELLQLQVSDYSQKDETLYIRATKFHKSRYVPVSSDTAREIETYLKVRQNMSDQISTKKNLIWNGSHQGNGYGRIRFRYTMHVLFDLAAIRTAQGYYPRIHDFRHAFAVHALLRWYETGVDIQAKLPQLATYMGHVSIVSTQRYLHFVEKLASASNERFAACCANLVEVRPKGGRQ